MKAIQIDKFGGPTVLSCIKKSIPKLKANQVLIKLKTIGVNYIDTYQRSGLYKVNLPYILGLEGAGFVERIGSEVKDFSICDRVAYTGSSGAYAEYAIVESSKLVILPETVDFETGAAALLQGMTAHYLTCSTFILKPGYSCLIHAAAGGVGLLLIQMAKMCGATVFGTVSTEEKAALAKDAGADEVILYAKEDFEKQIKKITNKAGVDVVYDSVGKTTFDKSLNCLKPLGYMILYGQSSGPVPPFDPTILNNKGSLFLTRPSLFHYISDRESLNKRANDVFNWIASGKLKIRINHRYPLEDAAHAHRDLEARKTSGKILLIP